MAQCVSVRQLYSSEHNKFATLRYSALGDCFTEPVTNYLIRLQTKSL